MVKKFISLIIAIAFTITSITKDSLALRPIAYKDHGSVRSAVDSAYDAAGKEILSLDDEIEAVVENLIKQLPPETRISPEEKKRLIDFIWHNTNFVSSNFFRRSYRILSFFPVYVMTTLSGLFLFSIFIYYAISSKLAMIGAAVSLTAILKLIIEGNLKKTPGYLAQKPNTIHILALPALILATLIFIDLLPRIMLYLLIYYIIIVMVEPRDKSKRESFTYGHFIKGTTTGFLKNKAERELIIHSAQAMYFGDWNKIYLRWNIGRDDFHKIISYLLVNGLFPSNIDLQDAYTHLGSLMKKDVSKDIYIFYNNREEQDNELYVEWVLLSGKQRQSKGPDFIKSDLAGTSFRNRPEPLRHNTLLPHSGRIKPLQIRAISAAA